MDLYNSEDIAVKTIQNFSTLEVSLGLDNKEAIPDSVKAEVVMVGSSVEKVKPGDTIYYDPGFERKIKELDLVVLHKKGILLFGEDK